jgi:hypothetical protein
MALLQSDGSSIPERLFGYRLFGLSVRSPLPLPELVPTDLPAAADVTIRMERLPPIEGEKARGLAVVNEGAVLTIPGAARYLVRGGSEIVVDADPQGSLRHLRLYLLGSAFGALLHQRGLLPLHGNSIEIAGRAVAFLGHSGAGKSTMAAWFHDRGFEVLADDVCVVTFDGPRPLAHPGIPRLRMWRDALEASGRSAEGYELSFDDAEKYNVPTRIREEPGPVDLGAIYLLKRAGPDAEEGSIERLRGVEALDALVANTYRGAYLPMLGGTQRHLASCLAGIRRSPALGQGTDGWAVRGNRAARESSPRGGVTAGFPRSSRLNPAAWTASLRLDFDQPFGLKIRQQPPYLVPAKLRIDLIFALQRRADFLKRHWRVEHPPYPGADRVQAVALAFLDIERHDLLVDF